MTSGARKDRTKEAGTRVDMKVPFWSRWEISVSMRGSAWEIEVGAMSEAVSTLGSRVTARYATRVMMDVSRAQPQSIMKRTSTPQDARQPRVR